MGQKQAYLDIDLVPAEHNRNIFTDAFKIAMPVGNVLIGDAGRDVKHYDATLALDVVAIAETTKLFLAGGIPDIEHDRAKVGGEGQRVNLNSERGCVMVARCVSNEKKRDATGQDTQK